MAEFKHLFCTLSSKLGNLSITTLGTEEWTTLLGHRVLELNLEQNVLRPTFKRGMMSVIQQHEDAAVFEGHLIRPLFLWKSTFSFRELYNVRVKEYGICKYPDMGLFINRIELLAVCKALPAGQLLEIRAGSDEEIVYANWVQTIKPVPIKTKRAVAEFSDRWKTGYQEIRLTFSRSKKTVGLWRDTPEYYRRAAGTLHWIWNAFLAFLCGTEWSAPTHQALDSAFQMSLEQVVASPSGNHFADFERMNDGWILIKP